MKLIIAYKVEKLQIKFIEFLTGIAVEDHSDLMQKMKNDDVKKAIGCFTTFISNVDAYSKDDKHSIDNKLKEYILSRIDNNADDFEKIFGNKYSTDMQMERNYKKCLDCIHDDYFILKYMKEEGNLTQEAKSLYAKIMNCSIGFEALHREFVAINKKSNEDSQLDSTSDVEESWNTIEKNEKYTEGEWHVYCVERYADMRNIASWTEWCVARKDGQIHFDTYKRYGGDYFVFCKGKRNIFALMHTGSTQFKDINDVAIDRDRPSHEKVIDVAKNFLDSMHFDYRRCKKNYPDFNVFLDNDRVQYEINKEAVFTNMSDSIINEIVRSTQDESTLCSIALYTSSNEAAEYILSKHADNNSICNNLATNQDLSDDIKKKLLMNGDVSSYYCHYCFHTIDLIKAYCSNPRIDENTKRTAIVSYVHSAYHAPEGLLSFTVSRFNLTADDFKSLASKPGITVTADDLKHLDDEMFLNSVGFIASKCKCTTEALDYIANKTEACDAAICGNIHASPDALEKIANRDSNSYYAVLCNPSSSVSTIEKCLLETEYDDLNSIIMLTKLSRNEHLNDKIYTIMLDKYGDNAAKCLVNSINVYRMSFDIMKRIADYIHDESFVSRCIRKDYISDEQRISLAGIIVEKNSSSQSLTVVFNALADCMNQNLLNRLADTNIIKTMFSMEYSDLVHFSSKIKKLDIPSSVINEIKALSQSLLPVFSWCTKLNSSDYEAIAMRLKNGDIDDNRDAIVNFFSNPSVPTEILLDLANKSVCNEMRDIAVLSGRLSKEQLNDFNDNSFIMRGKALSKNISSDDIDMILGSGKENAIGELIVNNRLSSAQLDDVCNKFIDSKYICLMVASSPSASKACLEQLYAKGDELINRALLKNRNFSLESIDKRNLKKMTEAMNAAFDKRAEDIFASCVKNGKLDGEKLFDTFRDMRDAKFIDYCARNSHNIYMLGGISANSITSDDTLLKIIKRTPNEELFATIAHRDGVSDTIALEILLKTKSSKIFYDFMEEKETIIRKNAKKIITVNNKIRFEVLKEFWQCLDVDFLKSLQLLEDEDVNYILNNVQKFIGKNNPDKIAMKIAQELWRNMK